MSELKKAFILEDNHNNMNILQVKIQNEKPKISDSNQMSEILNLIFVHDPNKRADSKTVFQVVFVFNAFFVEIYSHLILNFIFLEIKKNESRRQLNKNDQLLKYNKFFFLIFTSLYCLY